MSLNICQSSPQDLEEIVLLVKKAFQNAEHTDGKEHVLVERLQKSKNFIPELSLIARQDNQIVGYLLFTEIYIQFDENKYTSLALAPVAVLPEYQKQGIGKNLIRKGHEVARKLGYTTAIVLGDPNYYALFGYEKSSLYGIYSPFEVPEEFFMIKELVKGATKGLSGKVIYPKEFLEL